MYVCLVDTISCRNTISLIPVVQLEEQDVRTEEGGLS